MAKGKKIKLENIAMWLVLLGAINWLLVVLGFNVVTSVLGQIGLENTAYWVIGLSGVWLLFMKIAKRK